MDPERWKKAEKILIAVSGKPPPERIRFIEEACGDDKELKEDVLSLLAAQRKLGDFMATPPLKDKIDLDTATALIEKEDRSLLGTQVGPYRLEKVIASGGMGTVYLAMRSDESFQQKVAVKLIRGDLQNRDIIRRFYRERQTLANLNHANIARLLDGGTAEQGHPYLVMEYIEGTTVDAYCDDRTLNITERLKLFRRICSAVQYAHGKLVVHRDIKPANILVTKDGVPKLLDFGIVKILDPEEPLAGYLTLTMQRIMTPEYASPEQIRGESVSTSTDIFSMGVVLYELLTGHRPFRFPISTSREVERIVCEEDPPRPSTAVTQEVTVASSNGSERILTPESVSRTREGRPERLKRRLAGDLDHIIMKALRKEPDKRYASAEQFSEDIRRHLEGLPVLARKGTLKYRTEKFIKRNRTAAFVAGLVALLILMGAILGIRETRRAANLKAARDMRDVLGNLYKRPLTRRAEFLDKLKSEEHTRLAEELKDQPEELIEYAETIVQLCENLHLKNLAVQWWKISLDKKNAFLDPLDPELAETYFHYSKALWRVGRLEKAEDMIREAIDLDSRIAGDAGPSSGLLHNHLANILWYRGDFIQAKEHYKTAIEPLPSGNGRDPMILIDAMVDYAGFLEERGEVEEALEVIRRAEQVCGRMSYLERDLGLAKVHQILGRLLWHTPRFMEAEIYLRKAMESYFEYLKDEMDPRLISCMDDLVYVLQESGKYALGDTTTVASTLWRQAWKRRESLFGSESIEVARSFNTISYRLGWQSPLLLKKDVLTSYKRLWPVYHPTIAEIQARLHSFYTSESQTDYADRDPGESEQILRTALDNEIKYLSEGHWKIGLTRFFLGANLLMQNERNEGWTEINNGLTILNTALGHDHPSHSFRLTMLAEVCESMNLTNEAEHYRAEAKEVMRKWPYGDYFMDCDLTRERYSLIDFEDDNLEKIIIIPDDLDIYSNAYLWVFGRPDNYEWKDFDDIKNARIRVNDHSEQEIEFNVAVKFLYLIDTYQWVPFEIPLDWLQRGENIFTIYIASDDDYLNTRSWEYNNLSVGIDTSEETIESNRSWWVGASSYCCKEFAEKTRKSKKPLSRDSDFFKEHRIEGYEECEGELMIFLELHRKRGK